jgi:hypothetical protein
VWHRDSRFRVSRPLAERYHDRLRVGWPLTYETPYGRQVRVAFPRGGQFHMAILDTLATTGAGALSATVGVLIGGLLSRRSQHRQWLQDKQLAVYVELLAHYARFTMILKRAHADRAGWDYDWGAWSATLTTASLVAPAKVAIEIDNFGQAVDVFLDRVGRVDPITHSVSEEEFFQASHAPAKAQIALVNAIRQSMGPRHGALTMSIGGSLGRRSDPPSETNRPAT